MPGFSYTARMSKEFSAARLDVRAFAQSAGHLQGQSALSAFPRLAEDAQPDAADGHGEVHWQADGELVEQTGGSGQVWLHLQADAVVPMVCQRCLTVAPISLQVDRSFRFVADETTAESEDDESDEDLLVLSREFNLLERRCNLVFNNFHAGGVANNFFAVLQRPDAADVQTNRSVELQRIAAGCGFRAAEHHADFHPDLVNKNHRATRARDRAGQFAHRLAHQAGMNANAGIAHITFQLGFGRQCCHRIDNNHTHGTRAHQCVGNFQGLLTCVGLRDQKIVSVDPQIFGIERIQRMFCVDKSASAAGLLRLGHTVQRQRGLAR